MSDQNRVIVKIYGQTYTITGDASAQDIRALAKFVDDKMHRIGGNARKGPAVSVAVLTALNIAEELQGSLKKNSMLKQEVKRLSGEVAKYHRELDNYQRLWEEMQSGFNKQKHELAMKREKNKELEIEYIEMKRENVRLKNALDKENGNE